MNTCKLVYPPSHCRENVATGPRHSFRGGVCKWCNVKAEAVRYLVDAEERLLSLK